MKLLEGKVAVVTGAARGIGKAIAMKFAQEGASVAFTDLKADENFQNTEKELQALGVKAKGYTSNAADFEDTAKVVSEIVKDFGRIDVLVNNDSPIADRGLINESLSTEVDRALSTLTDRERDIIKYFFGIGCSEMTLEEIGEKFGLTRERVRQIKEKAIRRLRHSTRSKLLKSYLG